LNYYSAEKRSEAQRIFRRIAGIQVVIPDLMVKSDDEIEKAFGKIIKIKENWNLPWESKEGKSIIREVKKYLKREEIKNKVNKWKLLEILYSYSFTLPIFYFRENSKYEYSILERNNFKGFFVLKSENIDLKEIKKYGVNKIKNIDIDGLEIKEYEKIV